jgi:Skp family chaperone for outer membrane proteins
MSKVLEELKEVITNSDLSPMDQNDLLIFLPILPEKVLEELVKIFKKSPKILKAFNEDFKAKLEALIDGREAYQRMVEKEQELLKIWEEEFANEDYKEDEKSEKEEEEDEEF